MVKFLLLAGGAKGSAISRLVKELDKGSYIPFGSGSSQSSENSPILFTTQYDLLLALNLIALDSISPKCLRKAKAADRPSHEYNRALVRLPTPRISALRCT
ncbi:hypothetical protein HRR85_009608 [Exophiala dermatitidis]|nr:hypothetical protein HRR85_009608 [Exophiala dermatitidis]